MRVEFRGFLTKNGMHAFFEQLLEDSSLLKEDFEVYVDITHLRSGKNEVRMTLNGIRSILKNRACRKIAFSRQHDEHSSTHPGIVGKYPYKNAYIS